ncbi:uncharacterized protein V6R79_018264 [Siganus canaliculatus]
MKSHGFQIYFMNKAQKILRAVTPAFVTLVSIIVRCQLLLLKQTEDPAAAANRGTDTPLVIDKGPQQRICVT